MQVKRKDYLLYAALRENARATLTTLSKKTKIPISTIYERLRKQYGTIITKYATIFNYQKLGYPVRIFFILKVHKAKKEQLKSFLRNVSCVNTVHRINHGFDYLGDALFKNMNAAEQFLEVLEDQYAVKKQETFYILETVKEEGFMPEDQALFE